MNTYLTTGIFTIPIINSTSTIMRMTYWLGLISCVYYGIQKSKGSPCPTLIHCVMNALFGGLARDTVILCVTPWLFSLSALPDLTFVYISYIILAKIDKKYPTILDSRIWNSIMWWIDCLSLSSFLTIGYDKAIGLGGSTISSILSGYLTATAGGVLANFHNMRTPLNLKQLWYHIVVLLNCIVYNYLSNAFILLILIPVLLSLAEINFSSIYALHYYNICFLCSRIALVVYPVPSPQFSKFAHRIKTNYRTFFSYILNFKKIILMRKYRTRYSYCD